MPVFESLRITKRNAGKIKTTFQLNHRQLDISMFMSHTSEAYFHWNERWLQQSTTWRLIFTSAGNGWSWTNTPNCKACLETVTYSFPLSLFGERHSLSFCQWLTCASPETWWKVKQCQHSRLNTVDTFGFNFSVLSKAWQIFVISVTGYYQKYDEQEGVCFNYYMFLTVWSCVSRSILYSDTALGVPWWSF